MPVERVHRHGDPARVGDGAPEGARLREMGVHDLRAPPAHDAVDRARGAEVGDGVQTPLQVREIGGGEVGRRLERSFLRAGRAPDEPCLEAAPLELLGEEQHLPSRTADVETGRHP